MRRGSVVGPLLVILIGVWFLISTLRPDLPLLDIAARFWPFVLVAWGALRLLEIGVWAKRGRPLPTSGISGGEWTLVVFICLFGSGLYVVNRNWRDFGMFHVNRVEWFGHAYDYTVNEVKTPVAKQSRLVVENLRGDVRITGGDGTDVTIGGRKTVRALNEGDAAASDRQTPVEASVQPDLITVRSNQERVTGEQRVSTDLEITIPRGMTVEVRGRNGDIEVNDLTGGVEVSSDNAGVRLQNIGGNVRLDLRRSDLVRAVSVKGNFSVESGHGRDLELETIAGEVTVNGSFSGDMQLRGLEKPLKMQAPNTDLRVERLPGEIHMDLGQLTGSNLVGPIHLSSTRSRDVDLEQFTQSLDLSVDRGDVKLRPMQVPVAKITARTRNGQMEIVLPEKGKFELKAITSRGEVSNQFGEPLKTTADENDDEHRHGGTIIGALGQGPAIVVQTDRGGLTVSKDNGGPLVARNSKSDDDEEKPPKPPKPPKPEKPEIQRQ